MTTALFRPSDATSSPVAGERGEDGGDWPEWRRLVLGEQRRMGDDLRTLTREVRALAAAADVVALERRVTAAEQRVDQLEDRIDTYRKTIGAMALTIFATIGFPIARAWLTAKGGGG